MAKILVAFLFVGLNLYIYQFFAQQELFPDRDQFSGFPLDIGNWNCTATQEMDDETLAKLDVTDYLLCDYTDVDQSRYANVYVGYHASQTRDTGGDDNIIHPPEHCLPGAGWDIIENEIVPMDIGLGGEARRLIIAKGNLRNLVYFWYQSRGRAIARNHEKVMYLFLDRVFSGRTDGSLVRFTIPIMHGDKAAAEESFESIAQVLAPMLPAYVPN